jgi:hypothetical protein
VALLLLPSLPPPATPDAQAQTNSHTFPQTGKTVRDRFLRYWVDHGATAQQGLPISEEMQERSDSDGKVYTVQYFERAVFEAHPDYELPYDVLLSLLGVFQYKQKYPNGAPGQVVHTSSNYRLFPETGKRVGCEFLDYWEEHGGLAQQGYPISDEFIEVSDLNGQPYRVQYFERAVFEFHPENEPQNRVLLSQLGTFRYRDKHGGQAGTPTATPRPSANAGTCVPTMRQGNSSPKPDAPPRASVGTGHILRGVVKGEGDCAPIGNAKLVFWLTRSDGEYDDAHRGAVFTNNKGEFRFESNYPGAYGGSLVPHIHVYAEADGYRSVETEQFPACGETEATFDLVLARASTPTPAP